MVCCYIATFKSLGVIVKVEAYDKHYPRTDYNAYAQVYRVSNIAADLSTHVLNSTEIDIASPSNPTDVPRFTSTSTKAENFNGGNAVIVTNTVPAAAADYSLATGISINSRVVKVGVAGHPDQLYTRVHYGGSHDAATLDMDRLYTGQYRPGVYPEPARHRIARRRRNEHKADDG